MNRNILKLSLIAVVVVGGIAGLAIWLKSVSPTSAPANPNIKGEQVFIRPYSHMTGKADAKVTLVEFADFQCPACAAHFGPVKQIVDKYKTNPDFNFVNRNFPLASHGHALISAQAAEAAASQNKYWEMMELLYKNQSNWAGSISPTNAFVGYAQELGLDVDKFKDEVMNARYIDNIMQDLKDGEAFGVAGTPTFYLNGKILGNISELDAKIQILLSQ